MSSSEHASKRSRPSDSPDAPSKKRSGADHGTVSMGSDEAITEEEIQGTEAPEVQAPKSPAKPRNACTRSSFPLASTPPS